MPEDVGQQLRRFRNFMDRAPGDGPSPPRSFPMMQDTEIPPPTPVEASIFLIDGLIWGSPLVTGLLILIVGLVTYFRGS